MCRWFAYISATEDCLLEDVLITPKHSLVKQVDSHYLPNLLSHSTDTPEAEKEISARNKFCNLDGFGVVWYNSTRSHFEKSIKDGDLRPVCYRTTSPPLHDSVFRSICASTATKVCFGHVRFATASAVSKTNNHPFVFGRYSFMHNGEIDQFTDIKAQLIPHLGRDEYANIAGSTDSEHLAALFISVLTNKGGTASWQTLYTTAQIHDALHRAIEIVIGLQHRNLKDPQPNSLNIVVTDGIQLVALRYRNHESERPPSLYYSTNAGVTMNRKYGGHADGEHVKNPDAALDDRQHGSHLIVASEPTTYRQQDWTLVERNHAVMRDGEGKVTVEPMRPMKCT